MSPKKILFILLSFLFFHWPVFSQLQNPKTFRLPTIIRGMSNYTWKIYLMTDAGLYYWYKKVPEMDKGAYVCSPLGNHFYLATEDGDLLQFDANEFEQEDKFNIKLKEEKFTKLFFEGEGQELYGVTSKGRVFRINPESRKETLTPVHKGFGGYKVVWNSNLSTFVSSKGKLLQYIRLDGKAPAAPVALDRGITALQVDDSRFEVIAGLDNGKVVGLEQDLKTKKWTHTIGAVAITSVQWHPKDHYLFVGDLGGKVSVFDTKKKKVLVSKKIHTGAVDLRVLVNAQGELNLATVGMDSDFKIWAISDLAPDYHRIVREILEYREIRFFKKAPTESQKSYEARTSAEQLSKYLTSQRNQIIDSLAIGLRTTEKVTLAPKGDSIVLTVNPFRPIAFYAGKFGSLNGARIDSLHYLLQDDNDFALRKFKVVTTTGQEYKYDQAIPQIIQKTDVPIELAREIAQEELTIKDELSKLVEGLKNRGELNNVQLNMEAALKVDRDSLGRDELNLHVTYVYQGIKTEFNGVSADYPSGKYRLSESKAGTLLVDFLLNSAREQLSKHIEPQNRVTFRLTGSTDKTKVSSKLPYGNEFGTFKDYPYFFQGNLAGLNVSPETGITTNSQLGFLRTYAVRNYLEKQPSIFSNTRNKYQHFSEEADGYGPEFRKVKIEIIVHDINKSNAGK